MSPETVGFTPLLIGVGWRGAEGEIFLRAKVATEVVRAVDAQWMLLIAARLGGEHCCLLVPVVPYDAELVLLIALPGRRVSRAPPTSVAP